MLGGISDFLKVFSLVLCGVVNGKKCIIKAESTISANVMKIQITGVIVPITDYGKVPNPEIAELSTPRIRKS